MEAISLGATMPEETSDNLLERVHQGDQGAATELFHRYVRRLVALARSRLPGALVQRVDPEDVVQSAYRSFFAANADGRYDSQRGDDLWELLATITLHKVHRQIEHFKAQKRGWDRELHFGSEDSLLGLHAQALDAQPSPAEAAALTDEVAHLMRRLDPEQRLVLELRLQGHQLQEIADQTGRSVRTVKRHREASMTVRSARNQTPDVEKISADFEAAWQAKTTPPLDHFLPPPTDPRRHVILQELIKIDLEYRWRQAGRGTPSASGQRLEDYVRRYVELGPLQELPLDLIAEEYWVRCQWGDRPSAGDYLRRFPRHGTKLRERLAQVDAAVAREAAPAASARQLPSPPLAVPVTTNNAPLPVSALLQRMQQLTILTPTQCAQTAATRFPDSHALVRDLLQRGWLTPFQANLLLQGRAAELIVGAYLLLERIGQGGAGDVYKVRHQHMERIVALKVIKKELVADPEVMARFLREVKVASQMAHPNVVHAYDAGPYGGNYFLAMEYVEGTDLARLVKEKGPLPASQACAYISQAALGLQHIHDRSLVHRDIKPSNLLVASPPASDSFPSPAGGVVKILDLGLARLRQPAVSEAAARLTGPEAMIMGTLDYMAPEQAIDFRSADIRADIYSLGCTFYYLLTGQAPFPDCTVAEKLLRHQQAEPKPVEQLRCDLPAHLGPVLRRMMAKSPEARFQAPSQIAGVLGATPATHWPVAVASPVALTAPPAASPTGGMVVVEGAAVAPSRTWQRLSLWLRAGALAGPVPNQSPRERWRRKWLLAAGALFVVGLLLWWVTRGERSPMVFLTEMPESAVGPGGFSKHGSARLSDGDVRRLSVDGKLAHRGLFMFPPSKDTAYVRYRLGKQFKLLEAAVSINDSSNGSTPLTFTVVGDGRKLWESKPVKNRKEGQSCAVDVTGIDLLELAITCPGPNQLFPNDRGWDAHAVWIDPVLRR
jgi:RNA polymerase sigma factor (sigma-70 family)